MRAILERTEQSLVDLLHCSPEAWSDDDRSTVFSLLDQCDIRYEFLGRGGYRFRLRGGQFVGTSAVHRAVVGLYLSPEPSSPSYIDPDSEQNKLYTISVIDFTPADDASALESRVVTTENVAAYSCSGRVREENSPLESSCDSSSDHYRLDCNEGPSLSSSPLPSSPSSIVPSPQKLYPYPHVLDGYRRRTVCPPFGVDMSTGQSAGQHYATFDIAPKQSSPSSGSRKDNRMTAASALSALFLSAVSLFRSLYH